MSTGEYDTPGPYRNEGRAIFSAGCDFAQGSISARMDQAEQDEFVGLLNKGTHCDALMRVVYELLRYPEDKPPFDAAHTAFEAVMGREWDDEMDGE